MSKNKKKILIIVLAIFAVSTIAVVGTIAYSKANDSKINTLLIGSIKIVVEEPNYKEPTTPMQPGDSITKDPQIKNTGANDAFVRVDLIAPMNGAGQYIFELLPAANITTSYSSWSVSRPWYEPTVGQYGYAAGHRYIYYYTYVTAAGGKTTPLFTSIKLRDIDLSGISGSLQLIVDASGIQTRFDNKLLTGKDAPIKAFVEYWGK